MKTQAIRFFLITLLACAQSLALAQLKGSAIPTQEYKGTAGAAPAIVVEITSFTITPSAPKYGDDVQVKATIKNSGTGTVASVPWSIGPQNSPSLGDQAGVAPGSSFEVKATWKAVTGPQKFQVFVDPTGTKLKNTAPVDKQIKEINVTVVDTIATRYLEFGNVGSTKMDALSSGKGLCSARYYDANLGQLGNDSTPYKGVVVGFYCDVAGGSGDVEILSGVKLKNGWKVVNATVPKVVTVRNPTAAWSWMTKPQAESDSLYMKLHFANSDSTVPPGPATLLLIQVQIRGPEHQDPYK